MIKIKRIIRLWYLLFIAFFIVESSFGQDSFNDKTDSLIQSGIEFSIKHDYAKAELNFQQLIDGKR